jgi:hypothetical protein
MARDRNRTDDWFSAPDRGGRPDMDEERRRDGAEEDVRGVTDEGDEDFEDSEDLEEEEEDEESY